jgi:transposase-like protein
MRETRLNLTKDQLQSVINDHIKKENGANELFSALINGLMYCEREEFLSQPGVKNKANGFRRLIKSGINSGLELHIPRDRMSMFKPIILGIINNQEEVLKEISLELYGKGLTTREISKILEKIYGKTYSKSTISNISKSYYELMESWAGRKLQSYYPVVMIDAIHLKVKRDSVETEAFYIVLGLTQDFKREIISVENLPSESSLGWEEVLLNLKKRGLQEVDLFVSDDLSGLDCKIQKVFKESKHQKCVLHFQRNLLKHIRIKDRQEFASGLKSIFDPEIDKVVCEGVKDLKNYLSLWLCKYPGLKKYITSGKLDYYFTYYSFHRKVRRMLYTTNWIERFNKSIRRTTKIRNSLPNPESAKFLICYKAMEMECGTYKYPIYDFRYEDKFLKCEYMENS